MHILIKRIFFSPHADYRQKSCIHLKKAVSRGWEWPEAKPENKKKCTAAQLVLQGVV